MKHTFDYKFGIFDNNKNKVGPELLGQLKMIPLTLFTMKLDYVVNRKENN